MDCEARKSLRARINHAVSSFSWFQGIRGLCLRIDRLKHLGASNEFLRLWTIGHKLNASVATAKFRNNHPSFRAHELWAEKEFDRLHSLGKITLFPPNLPRPHNLNVNPCALLLKLIPSAASDAADEQKYKARLLMDLSAGGVNPRVPGVPVSYGTVDQAVAMLSPNGFIYVIDLQDAFFNWRVDLESSFELGFYSPKRKCYGKYDYLPFGLGPSPGFNDASVKEILRLAKQHCNISVVDFVDDLIGHSATEEQAWSDMNALVSFLSDVGIPVSTKSSGLRFPSQRQLWIGWVFDTVAGTISIDEIKLKKVTESIDATLREDTQGTLDSRLLAQCAGLWNHIGELDAQFRRRLHPIWSDLNAAGVYHLWQRKPRATAASIKVQLSEQSRRHLEWALRTLVVPPQRPMFCVGTNSFSTWTTKSPDFLDRTSLIERGLVFVVFTDASSEHGWSYTVCNTNRVVNGVWPAELMGESINWKELWVVLQTLRLEKSALRGWRVLFRVDNSAAVHYVNVRYGNILALERLSEDLDKLERSVGCVCLAEHIEGKRNIIADEGSRVTSFADSWNNDSLMDAVLREDLFNTLVRDLGAFDVDLFADSCGTLSLAPKWHHPANSAFEADLSFGQFWAHPPKSIVGRFIDHVASETKRLGHSVRIAVLVPCDSGAPWFRNSKLHQWRRRQYWPANSDLFRRFEVNEGRVTKRKCPRTSCAYAVLTSW